METTQAYKIYFNTELDCVVMDWDGYATSEEFREGTETMLNLLIAHKATKVIADTKDMAIIGTEDQKWLESTFLPRAIRFGFKACAMIRSNSYFNNVAIESVSLKVDQKKLQINFFENIAQAENWLKTI